MALSLVGRRVLEDAYRGTRGRPRAPARQNPAAEPRLTRGCGCDVRVVCPVSRTRARLHRRRVGAGCEGVRLSARARAGASRPPASAPALAASDRRASGGASSGLRRMVFLYGRFARGTAFGSLCRDLEGGPFFSATPPARLRRRSVGLHVLRGRRGPVGSCLEEIGGRRDGDVLVLEDGGVRLRMVEDPEGDGLRGGNTPGLLPDGRPVPPVLVPADVSVAAAGTAR